MTRKTLALLLIATIALLLGLYIAKQPEEQTSTSDAVTNKGAKASIHHIRVSGATHRIADIYFERGDNRWVEKTTDYPANIELVNELLGDLKQIAVVAKKTSNPELHNQLGVADKSETAILLELNPGSNSAQRWLLGNLTDRGRFTRLNGDNQVRETTPALVVPPETVDWLDQELFDISAERVQQITISHLDGTTVHLSKDTPAEPLPLASGEPISGLASELRLESVLPGYLLADVGPAATIVIDTFDGLQLTANAYNTPDGFYFIFDATGHADDANAINQRVSGWAYTLPDYKSRQFLIRTDTQ